MNKYKLFNNDLKEENIYQTIRDNLVIAASMSNAAIQMLWAATEDSTTGLTKEVFETIVNCGKNASIFITNAEKLSDILNNLDIEANPPVEK